MTRAMAGPGRRGLLLGALAALPAPALRAREPTGALARVLALGTLRAGVWFRNPPWALIDPWGGPDGFEVALLRRLAAALSVRLDLVSLDPENRLPALERGVVDILGAGIPYDPGTLARVALAEPHGWLGAVMAMREEELVSGFEALRGRRVAVPAGAFLAEAAARALPAGTEVIFLDDPERCLAAVAERDADGAAVQEEVLRAHMIAQRETPLRPAFPIRRWRIALAVRLGERDFLHYVNGFLRVERAAGGLAALHRLYFRGAESDLGASP